MTTDSSGNIVIAGQVNGTVDGSATFGGGTDAFLTKLSSTGTLDYSQQFGGSGNQTATGVAVDGVQVIPAGGIGNSVQGNI